MSILLIAGHGAGDPGAVSGKYREADEARKVVSALRKRLGGACAVYPTDRDGYQDYKKGTLRSVAQFQDYDLVLEVHFNAFKASSADGKTKGVEAYVPKGGDKTVADKLCRAVSACGLSHDPSCGGYCIGRLKGDHFMYIAIWNDHESIQRGLPISNLEDAQAEAAAQDAKYDGVEIRQGEPTK